MSNSTYFNGQIERCLRLAGMCSDSIVAERLRLMAAEFQERADQIARGGIPPQMAGNGSGSGESNHS